MQNRVIPINALLELEALVGSDGLKLDEPSRMQYGQDWLGLFTPNPGAVALPASVEEVQALVRWANRHSVPLVPSGGRTGLSGGAVAADGELLISLEKLNRILGFDEVDAVVHCQSGVITSELQAYAEARGLFYPVDFASSGSSHIGGNIATNAGGIRVVRYGMTRDWVAGLKVVTGTGKLLDLGRALKKDATGYDLRHLLIGSEGTLGIIVEAEMRLALQPPQQRVLLLGLPDLSRVMDLLETFRRKVVISAFEFFSDAALSKVIAANDVSSPLGHRMPFYVLLEVDQPEDDGLLVELFEQVLLQGWVKDGVLSQSEQQRKDLWKCREYISASISRYSPYKHDISVRVSRVPAFLAAIGRQVADAYPNLEVIWFGHIADGNLHLNILKPSASSAEEFRRECDAVSSLVFTEVKRFGGSISAEHGIGLLKKAHLHHSRSMEEMGLMRSIRRVFDPKGVLNPGKLVD